MFKCFFVLNLVFWLQLVLTNVGQFSIFKRACKSSSSFFLFKFIFKRTGQGFEILGKHFQPILKMSILTHFIPIDFQK
jgi:hypothetical protein